MTWRALYAGPFKKVYSINDVSIEEEREDPFYVYHEVRTHHAFFEAVFRAGLGTCCPSSHRHSF
jgi:hypothetical protein